MRGKKAGIVGKVERELGIQIQMVELKREAWSACSVVERNGCML